MSRNEREPSTGYPEVVAEGRPGLSVGRQGPCEICKKLPAKYSCPRCSVRTCSLDCVKGEAQDTTLCTIFSSISNSFASPPLISTFAQSTKPQQTAAARGIGPPSLVEVSWMKEA